MMSKSPTIRQEAFFAKHLVDRLPDPVFCLSSDAGFIYLNDVACHRLEYSRQELLSMRLSDIDQNFQLKNWAKQWQSLKQQGSLTVESQYQTKSGKLLLVELTLVYEQEKEKEFCYTFVRPAETKRDRALDQSINQLDGDRNINNLYQEISQLKATEIQLAKTLSLVRGVLDSTAYGTVAVSYEGKVISRNQKFLEMWKIPDSLVLSNDSQECQDFFDLQLKNPQVFRYSVWEVSRESEAETYDILELKDGRVFAQYSKPQRLEDKIVGRVWSIVDITELKQQSESEIQSNKGKIEVVEAVEKAKQLSELRSRFLSMLCHQFRSSLNIISFSNSILKRYANTWNDDKKLPYLDNIQTAVAQITKLLDELVFLGKSEVGQVKFEPTPADLSDFCRALITQMQPISDDKQQTIEFASHGDCKYSCIDKNILHHIFTNLLSNSIKYSPDGSKIKFEISYESERAIIKIKDEGIGISEVDRQRLFDPFYRGSNVDSIPGTGLGLSIVSNLVEIHGGKIELESKVGIGTTFLLTIPLKSTEDESSKQ